MEILNGVALVVVGLGAMGFGLFLFYALLPLFYAAFGIGVGYWLGSMLTGAPPGETHWLKVVFGIGGGILFAGAAYFLEPLRRTLMGVALGSLLGGLIASAYGLTGLLGVVVMVVAGVAGALLVLAVFDIFIIVSSAIGGAGLAMDGLHVLLPGLTFVDRTAIADGALDALIVWVLASAIAIGWQFTNLARWTQQVPIERRE